MNNKTYGKYADGKLFLYGKSFSDKRLKGAQRKGMIFIDDTQEMFVKADEVTKAREDVKFQEKHDFKYSSITEEIVSRLIDNMNFDLNFPCLTYEFTLIVENNKEISATVSNNFIKNGYLEQLLTDWTNEPYESYLIDFDNFEKNIKKSHSNDEIFNNMFEYYLKYGVDSDLAKYFIIQQAGFDLLTGNIDRKGNCTNTVFIAKNENEVIPINIDFGRCLQMEWTDTTDNRFLDLLDDKELINEIELDYAESMIEVNGGILGNHPKFEENVKFILDKGFKPFKIDYSKLEKDLDDSCKKIKILKPNLYNFARTKSNALLKLLKDERTQQLWEEV